MSNIILGALILVCVSIAIVLITRKDKPLNENPKVKKAAIGVLGLAAVFGAGVVATGKNEATVKNPVKNPNEIKLQAELIKKEEMLAVTLDKLKSAQLAFNQAKAETEMHTSNTLELQEELLRRNDEFNLLKEELDLRYKVDANKILKDNEDKIRKSASAEAQKIIEKTQFEARLKVAKDAIESKIVSKWTPPKDKHNLTTVVKYTLDGNGRLVSVDLIQRSGAADVDNSVIEAIKAASPYEVSKEEAVRNATQTMVSKFVLP